MSRFSRSSRILGLVIALVGYSAGVSAQTAAGTQTAPDKAEAAEDTGWTTEASQEASAPKEAPKEAGATSDGKTSAPASTGSAAPKTSTSTAAGTKAEESLDGATYQVRLRDLEYRVDELKEQVRRSHTRLSLLSDTILAGGVGGARAEITFVNELSSAFRMTEAVFVLDGAVQYRKQDETGALAEQQTIPIFSGSIPAGDHTLQVLIKLRGHGYGVFSYLRGYQFELRDTHSFTVTDGKVVELKAVAWEKGGATTPLEERPSMRYVSNVRSLGEMPAAPASDSSGSSSGSSSEKSSGGSASGSVSVGGGN